MTIETIRGSGLLSGLLTGAEGREGQTQAQPDGVTDFAALLEGGDTKGFISQHGLAAFQEAAQQAELKKRLRAEMLAEMKVTEDQLAAMPPEQQAKLEKQIQDKIQQKMQEMAEAELDPTRRLMGRVDVAAVLATQQR